MTPGLFRRLISGILALIALAAVLGYATSFDAAVRATDGAVRIVELHEVTDGQRTLRTLPIRWRGTWDQLEERRYVLDVPTTGQDTDDLYLLIPYFEQRLQVDLDGAKIFSSEVLRPWPGVFSMSTALVLLPPDRLGPDGVQLTLTIGSGPNPPGSLSQLFVGPLEAVQGLHRTRMFLDDTLKPIVFGIQLLLGFSGLYAFALRPKDQVFGWLGLMLGLSTIVAAGMLVRALPGFAGVLEELFLLVPATGVSVLGFAMALAGREGASPILLRVLVLLTLGVTILRHVLGFDADFVGFFVCVPVMLVGILGGAWFLALSIRANPKADTIGFAVGLLILIACIVHDSLMRLGTIDTGIMVGQIARLFPLSAIAVFIVRRMSELADTLDAASETLRQRLAAKEAELAEVYARQRSLDNAQAVASERARITADLHDGVAGHLTAIVALAEAEDHPVQAIRDSARHALADLRLVIDALSVPGGDLRFYLGQFRDRCVDPLASLGIEIDWSMTRLPEVETIGRERALSVLRILQEALNNALRHSEPRQLIFRGDATSDGQVRLVVENIGGLRAAPDLGGQGLANIRRRVVKLGGSVHFTKGDEGGRLEVIFPA